MVARVTRGDTWWHVVARGDTGDTWWHVWHVPEPEAKGVGNDLCYDIPPRSSVTINGQLICPGVLANEQPPRELATLKRVGLSSHITPAPLECSGHGTRLALVSHSGLRGVDSVSRLNRRRWIGCGVIAAGDLAARNVNASATSSLQSAVQDYQVEDQLAFGGQTRRLKLTNGDRYMASLIFATDYPTHYRLKPEFYPFCTPKGVPVTDSHQYCFIHHQSIMTGHGKVLADGAARPVDFYRKLPYPDPDREDPFHKSHNLFQMGPSGIQTITRARWDVTDRITLHLVLQWQSREQDSGGGEPLVLEQRRYDLFQQGSMTVIDQFTLLQPAGTPITLMADRHSFVGIRVHDLLDPDDGGVMHDSEGRINPDGNYWDDTGERSAPRWIDCSGRIGDNEVGVTLISHPQNLRNEFYCRSWGLMICSATLGHDVRVTAEQPFRFAARYVAHDGPLGADAANRLYAAFSERQFPLFPNAGAD